MIRAGLWQADDGPRWLITVGYRDKVTPKALHELCAQGHARWGIYRCILVWYLRDDKDKASFPIDMRDVFKDAENVLISVGSSMVRSAINRGVEADLPQQFFGDRTPVLDPEGRPIPVGEVNPYLQRNSPVHPLYRAPTADDDQGMEDFLKGLRDGTVH